MIKQMDGQRKGIDQCATAASHCHNPTGPNTCMAKDPAGTTKASTPTAPHLGVWVTRQLAAEVDLEVVTVKGGDGHHVGVAPGHHLQDHLMRALGRHTAGQQDIGLFHRAKSDGRDPRGSTCLGQQDIRAYHGSIWSKLLQHVQVVGHGW